MIEFAIEFEEPVEGPRDRTLRAVDVTTPAVEAALAALREGRVNGGALLACLEAIPADAAPTVPSTWTTLGTAFYVVTSPALREALPELELPPDLDYEPGFQLVAEHALTLAGEIARAIFEGGAYDAYTGGAADAMRLANHLVDEMLGDRFDEATVERTYAEWSPWFGGIVDETLLVTDRGQERAWLLCLTDVD